MKGTMLVYKPELPTPVVLAELTRPPDAAALHHAVGGFLERVPYFFTTPSGARCLAFCDEDGKRKRLPINVAANDAWFVAMMRETGSTPAPDYLVGPIVVLTGDDEFFRAMTSDADEPEGQE